MVLPLLGLLGAGLAIDRYNDWDARRDRRELGGEFASAMGDMPQNLMGTPAERAFNLAAAGLLNGGEFARSDSGVYGEQEAARRQQVSEQGAWGRQGSSQAHARAMADLAHQRDLELMAAQQEAAANYDPAMNPDNLDYMWRKQQDLALAPPAPQNNLNDPKNIARYTELDWNQRLGAMGTETLEQAIGYLDETSAVGEVLSPATRATQAQLIQANVVPVMQKMVEAGAMQKADLDYFMNVIGDVDETGYEMRQLALLKNMNRRINEWQSSQLGEYNWLGENRTPRSVYDPGNPYRYTPRGNFTRAGETVIPD